MRVSKRLVAVTVSVALTATSGATVAAYAVALPTVPQTLQPLCGQAKPARPARPTTPIIDGKLTIGQFNVLHGLTDEGDRTLEARTRIQIAKLAASNADVLGLEEVSETSKHGRVITKLATGLAQTTHHTWWWCWMRTEPHFPEAPDTTPGGGDPLSDLLAEHYNSPETKWYEGAAILSRWPITASAAHRLPGEDIAGRLQSDCRPPFTDDPTCTLDLFLEPRAALWTRVSTPYGPISVTVAHTSGNADQHADLVQWARARSAKDATALLVCDCNSLEQSDAQAAIRNAGWTDTYRTLHSHGGATADQQIGAAGPTVSDRIDYAFLRTGSAMALRSSVRFMNHPVRSSVEKSGWLWPSDHWGVLDTIAPEIGPLPHTG